MHDAASTDGSPGDGPGLQLGGGDSHVRLAVLVGFVTIQDPTLARLKAAVALLDLAGQLLNGAREPRRVAACLA